MEFKRDERARGEQFEGGKRSGDEKGATEKPARASSSSLGERDVNLSRKLRFRPRSLDDVAPLFSLFRSLFSLVRCLALFTLSFFSSLFVSLCAHELQLPPSRTRPNRKKNDSGGPFPHGCVVLGQGLRVGLALRVPLGLLRAPPAHEEAVERELDAALAAATASTNS